LAFFDGSIGQVDMGIQSQVAGEDYQSIQTDSDNEQEFPASLSGKLGLGENRGTLIIFHRAPLVAFV
jgi:hypothetical protein